MFKARLTYAWDGARSFARRLEVRLRVTVRLRLRLRLRLGLRLRLRLGHGLRLRLRLCPAAWGQGHGATHLTY